MVGYQLNLSQMLKEADRRINYDFDEFEDEDYVEGDEYFEDLGDREYYNVHDSGDVLSEVVMDVQLDKRTQVVFKNSHFSMHFLIASITFINFYKRQVLLTFQPLFFAVFRNNWLAE